MIEETKVIEVPDSIIKERWDIEKGVWVESITEEELKELEIKKVMKLNNSIDIYAMELEGGTVKEDFLNYSFEKMKYDAQVQADEQSKQEAYENELMYNPELTWEEFLMNHPTTITSVYEPVIPETVQAFIDKYLGVKATQTKVDDSNAETLEINNDATSPRTYFEKW